MEGGREREREVGMGGREGEQRGLDCLLFSHISGPSIQRDIQRVQIQAVVEQLLGLRVSDSRIPTGWSAIASLWTVYLSPCLNTDSSGK